MYKKTRVYQKRRIRNIHLERVYIYIHVFHQEPSTITYISRPPFPHQCPRDVNFGQC